MWYDFIGRVERILLHFPHIASFARYIWPATRRFPNKIQATVDALAPPMCYHTTHKTYHTTRDNILKTVVIPGFIQWGLRRCHSARRTTQIDMVEAGLLVKARLDHRISKNVPLAREHFLHRVSTILLARSA